MDLIGASLPFRPDVSGGLNFGGRKAKVGKTASARGWVTLNMSLSRLITLVLVALLLAGLADFKKELHLLQVQ